MATLSLSVADVDLEAHDFKSWIDEQLAMQEKVGSDIEIDCQQHRQFPSLYLAALGVMAVELKRRGASLSLVNISQEVSRALNVLGLRSLFQVKEPLSDGIMGPDERTWPFRVNISDNGVVIVLVKEDASESLILQDRGSFEWLEGVEARLVVVELGLVTFINSIMVAWLLQLNQAAGDVPVELRSVARQVAIQLNRLRIGDLMAIKQAIG